MQFLQVSQLNSVLCLGAHADDIEIGCGGTLLKWLAARPDLQVTWVVWSAVTERRQEAERSAEQFLSGAAQRQISIENFRDAYFPADWAAIKQRFGEIAATCQPDVIFTHRLADRHQDHRVLAELTWNAFRDHLILEYEIPKFEGDLGQPNFYVPISQEIADRKVALLHEFFPTQSSKDWFSESTFQALHRIRGLECRSASGLAEAFSARKLVCD